MELSRRGVIGGALAAVPAASSGALSAPDTLRPPFHCARDNAGVWRFRSWTWRDDAWRPLTGQVVSEGDALQVTGRPDPRDAAALQIALGRIARDRSG